MEVFKSELLNAPSGHASAGVYTITCVANGRLYIGSSSDVMNRVYGHKSRLRSGMHQVADMQADFERYGEWQFTFAIQELCDDADLAVALETVAIIRARKSKALYNKILPRGNAASVPSNVELPADFGNIDLCLARIRRYRTEKGMNRFSFACAAGIPEGCTRNMDDADWNPTVRTIQKLEAVIPKEYQPSFEDAA